MIDDNSKSQYVPLAYHVCTEEDFAKFHKPLSYQERYIEKRKQDKFFYCLDGNDLFGNTVQWKIWGDGYYMGIQDITI